MKPQPSHRGRGMALLLAATALGACATARRPESGWGPEQLDAERRCQQGASSACGELGRWLVDGSASDENRLERGLVLLEVACGGGDLPSCTTLGLTYLELTPQAPSRLKRAESLLADACQRRSAEGCTGLGRVMTAAGSSTAGLQHLRSGCNLGDALGCELLAEQLMSSGGVGPEADDALVRACGQGRLSSCHLRATAYLRDPERRPAALPALHAICGRGFAPSCRVLALTSAPLLASEPDCSAALPPAERACGLQGGDVCAVVQACKLDRDRERPGALDHLRSDCESTGGLACLYWADALEHRFNRRHDAQVVALYARVCRGGGPGGVPACTRLAAARLAGSRSKLEAEGPLKTLREACLSPSGEACCLLADVYRAGRWLAPDAEMETDLRRRSCELGHRRCCEPAPPAGTAPE